MKNYMEFVEIWDQEVDGERNWTWIKGNHGAWDGPKQNWEGSHKDKFFKYTDRRTAIVTAGANCGMYCRFYAKMFQWVYAFEPDPLNFHCLVANNPFDNVIKMQCALGAEDELIRVVGTDNLGNTGTHTVVPGGFVPCFRIDTLGLTHCDIIQLDTEGYEFNVLSGARKTIEKFRPVITAENGRGDAIMNLMKELRYEYKDQSASDAVWTPLP